MEHNKNDFLLVNDLDSNDALEKLKEIKSPLIEQYMSFKLEYKDYIVFFQVGEFFELYEDDAKIASKKLDLKLTGKEIKNQNIPMCGFPSRSGEEMANKLAKIGYKVLLVSQEKNEEGVAERFVSGAITPSTISSEEFLEDDENQCLMTVYQIKDEVGITIVDMMSGEIITHVGSKYIIFDLIARYQPKEVKLYVIKKWENEIIQRLQNQTNIDIIEYLYQEMKPKIDEHKEKHFNNEFTPFSIIGSHYFMMQNINKFKGNQITLKPIKHLEERDYLYLHQNCIYGLELFENQQTRKKDKTLFQLLNETKTAKGARTLKRWIQEPLIDAKKIEYRYSMVNFFLNKKELRVKIQNELQNSYDIERILARIEKGRAKDAELVNLLVTLFRYKSVFDLLKNELTIQQLATISEKCEKICTNLINELEKKLDIHSIIKEGYNEEYDNVKETKEKGLSYIEEYFQSEKEASGIKTMKLDENKVLGYFFEITKSQFDKVPAHFTERSSLTDKKRYVTETLKELEQNYYESLLNFDSLYRKVIRTIFQDIYQKQSHIKSLLDFVSFVDVIMGFADVAEKYHYKKPIISNDNKIEIKNGLHPLLQAFNYKRVVPNDFLIEESGINIVTGPNMGGKSTYLKMAGTLVLMAQIGSFVPAAMKFHPVDRILLRMGASDALLNNQSTFMVEMEEVAYIVYHATKNSLIIMDELGRGTSTNDGISIAYSVIEYIHSEIKAKTICSTHYHELIELEKNNNDIKNYHAESQETEHGLELTYKIVQGGSTKSFGIEVAKKVGLPKEIVEKAVDMLNRISKK